MKKTNNNVALNIQWTTQDHTPFTMALFDPMRGQHSVHQLAHSLLLSAIQVVLNMSGTCAESLADLADIALRLLIGSWQRDLEGETQGGLSLRFAHRQSYIKARVDIPPPFLLLILAHYSFAAMSQAYRSSPCLRSSGPSV